MTDRTLELVVFELLDGVDEEGFLESAGAVTQWAAEQPGFISRDLSRTQDGSRWIEVAWWATRENALQAATASEVSESCAPMFSKINMESIEILHGTPAVSYQA